eukprot:431466_1
MVPSHQILNDKNRPPRVQRPARYKTKHTRRIITRTYYAIISPFGSGGISGLYGHIAPSVTCDDPTGRPLPCNRYIEGSECVHNGYHIPRNMGCIPLTSEYTCTLQENIYKWHQINGSKYPSCDSVSDHWHYCLIMYGSSYGIQRRCCTGMRQCVGHWHCMSSNNRALFGLKCAYALGHIQVPYCVDNNTDKSYIIIWFVFATLIGLIIIR